MSLWVCSPLSVCTRAEGTFTHRVYIQLSISRQVRCANTKWNLLSKCKTLQFDRRTLGDGHNFGELHFNLWLVLAHHACIHRERYRDNGVRFWGEFFSAQGLNRSRCVKINAEVRTQLCKQCIITAALGKIIIPCSFLSYANPTWKAVKNAPPLTNSPTVENNYDNKRLLFEQEMTEIAQLVSPSRGWLYSGLWAADSAPSLQMCSDNHVALIGLSRTASFWTASHWHDWPADDSILTPVQCAMSGWLPLAPNRC